MPKTKITAFLITLLFVSGLACTPAGTASFTDNVATQDPLPIDETPTSADDEAVSASDTEDAEIDNQPTGDNTSAAVEVEPSDSITDDFIDAETTPATDSEPVATEGEWVDESVVPVLFGFWGLNGYISSDGLADVATRFKATVFQVASSAPRYTTTVLLPLVKAQTDMHVTLRMTSDHGEYTTDGNFDLQKWKDQITAWQTACAANSAHCVQPFIDDGTLVGHMLLDDIFTFDGNDPSATELDEMARYSEEIFPGLMTFVRNKASTMPVPAGGQYVYLDACVNQYTNYQGYSDGPIATYVAEQASAAEELGIGVINGLNIADGGDGSSGVTGWGRGKYAMSAEEITTYGEALLDRNIFPELKLFLMWEYDGQELWSDGFTTGHTYFDQTDLQNALQGLGQMATE